MILFLVLLQFGIHVYRVASGSCYSSETDTQRCIRNWFHSQWGRRSSYFRYWALKAGLDLEFDYGCYAVIIDPRNRHSMMHDSLEYFGYRSPLHNEWKIAMKCHNEEMVRGYCKNKREFCILLIATRKCIVPLARCGGAPVDMECRGN
ncbi:hypothetical protein Ddc_11318 [Ditylenchus destructor]|nr:hypothetical protein Ddc_11318 [Ditylenchus destructor]